MPSKKENRKIKCTFLNNQNIDALFNKKIAKALALAFYRALSPEEMEAFIKGLEREIQKEQAAV